MHCILKTQREKHRMKYYIPLFLALLLMNTAPALADTNTPEESFTRITQCIKIKDAVSCRKLLTASSIDIYDRFVSYGLIKCLPANATYVSQKTVGNQVIIRASIMTGDNQQRYMRLTFSEEKGQWKLDVAESLRVGLGSKWEQQLNLTEQVYVLMQQQLGAKLNCDMIQNLASKNHS